MMASQLCMSPPWSVALKSPIFFFRCFFIVRFTLQTYQIMHRLKEVESDCLIPSRQEQTQPWKTTRAELEVPSFNLHRHLCIFLFAEKKKLNVERQKVAASPWMGEGKVYLNFCKVFVNRSVPENFQWENFSRQVSTEIFTHLRFRKCI